MRYSATRRVDRVRYLGHSPQPKNTVSTEISIMINYSAEKPHLHGVLATPLSETSLLSGDLSRHVR